MSNSISNIAKIQNVYNAVLGSLAKEYIFITMFTTVTTIVLISWVLTIYGWKNKIEISNKKKNVDTKNNIINEILVLKLFYNIVIFD